MAIKFSVKFYLFFLVAICVFSGCQAQPKVKLPAFSDLEEIEACDSGDSDQWDTDVVCWVGNLPETKWTWVLPHSTHHTRSWIKNNTLQIMKRLIREELENTGYQVKYFGDDYYTRQDRLDIQKQIFFKEFHIKQIHVMEGLAYDMKLVVTINDYPKKTVSTDCEVIKRHLLLKDSPNEDWDVLWRRCVKSLFDCSDFRNAIAMN